MAKVINIRDKKGTPDEVYIGRGSKWGNPLWGSLHQKSSRWYELTY